MNHTEVDERQHGAFRPSPKSKYDFGLVKVI
jgi:hypothetical protein